MWTIALLYTFAAALGVVVTLLVTLSPRFGGGSWKLGLFLLPIASASLLLAIAGWSDSPSPALAARAGFALAMLSIPGALVFSRTLRRSEARVGRWRSIVEWVACPLGMGLALGLHRPTAAVQRPELLRPEVLVMGPIGYVACLYVLALSTIVLAQLERTFRSADDRVRWEIKFLVVGFACCLGFLIYLSVGTLLTPIQASLLSISSLQVLPLVFLATSILFLVSWRRSTRFEGVVVSQSLVYSTVTFLTIGAYLIASSAIARWAGSLVRPSVETETIVLFAFVAFLGVALLSTQVRHRVRGLLRRHFFLGHYDYRTLWLSATRRIRSVDTPQEIADSIADLAREALGAVEVCVWLRAKEGGKLRLFTARGLGADTATTRLSVEFESPTELMDFMTPAEALEDGGFRDLGMQFFLDAQAALVGPLRSGSETVGLLTVGPDRSGRPYSWDAREFLGAIAAHAAGEVHNRELQAARIAATEAEAYRCFSTFVLHDLKNFASTLSMITKNADRDGADPEFQREVFTAIGEIADKMRHLCNSLAGFSRAPGSHRTEESLSDIVSEVLRLLQASVGERLKVELGDVPSLSLDRKEVAGVVRNLIVNAAEATASGGMIRIGTAREEESALLWVSDDGVGIPKTFLENELFVPFRTTKSDGLGVGLFQCKRVVEAHGGSIEVESEEGKGTTVRVRFPLGRGGRLT